jgi:hypothetical protein
MFKLLLIFFLAVKINQINSYLKAIGIVPVITA